MVSGVLRVGAGVILGYPRVRIRSGIRFRLRDATLATRPCCSRRLLPLLMRRLYLARYRNCTGRSRESPRAKSYEERCTCWSGPVPRSRRNCDSLRTRLERPQHLRTPELLPRATKTPVPPIPTRLTRSSAAQYSLRTSAGTPRWSQIWRG